MALVFPETPTIGEKANGFTFDGQAWVKELDLSENYYTKSEVDSQFVGVDPNKGLSDNNYTDAEKSKTANGQTAFGWGNHADVGYLTQHQSLSGYATETWVTSQGYKTTDTTYSAGTGLQLTGTSFSVKFGTGAGEAMPGDTPLLSGSSNLNITGTWDFQKRIKVKASKYVVNNLGNISGSKTIDPSAATEFTGTITGNTTFNFTNAPVSGESQVVYLRLTNAGAYTITWPSGTLFPGGVPPEFTEAGVDVVGCKYDPTAAKYIIMPIAMDIQVEA